MSIPVPQRVKKQLQGEFYPLQREELIKLREVKLINNAAYVHLALRYENPFCDRPVQIIPKEFAIRWRIPESSVYKAIAKLKELGILNIKSGKLVIDWIKPEKQAPEESQEQESAVNSNPVPSSNNSDSHIEQKIIRSDNSLSDSAKDYPIRENRQLEPLVNIVSDIPQTLQNFHTSQTQTEEEKKSHEEVVQQAVQKTTQDESQSLSSSSDGSTEKNIPESVVHKKTEIISPRKKSAEKKCCDT
ncbi:MAG: hypothetical protein AAFV28_06670 [Cyanobacteria bacterium J06635_13]